MNLSFLFDKNGKIDIRGLLAAIPLPLFLLLAYNLGILGLVVIGWISPYYNIGIVWIIDSINWFLFFYAAYRGLKTYKLGLISSLLSSLLCFVILTAIIYYVDYYLFTNDIGGLGESKLSATLYYKHKLEDMGENISFLPQIWHYWYECIKIEDNNLKNAICYSGVSNVGIRFIFGSILALVFGFSGWFFWKGKPHET